MNENAILYASTSDCNMGESVACGIGSHISNYTHRTHLLYFIQHCGEQKEKESKQETIKALC